MSARKRGATGLSGILLVDKPSGMTSHDVVSAVRRVTGEGRVGHAGTLDPMATGLLVVLVGPATRLEPHLSAAEKTYLAEVSFGAATDTDDAEGAVVREAPVPEDLTRPQRACEVLDGYLGESMQLPPTYSAIKVGGQTAHRAARSGAPLELKPRHISVLRAELLSIQTAPVRWSIEFKVSKGTYIRALARDIGESAGTAAHLSALRRTRSGVLDVRDAYTLAEVEAACEEAGPDGLWADPFTALDLAVMGIDGAQIRDGRTLERPAPPTVAEGDLVAVSVDGALGALYRARQGRLVSEVVFAHPVRGGS